MVRKLVLAVAAASALMSSNMVQALGVGEINLRSALNQPLEAEIELLQVRDLGSTEIRSVLASPDDFGRAGVDRSFFLTDLTFTPVVRPDGKAYIRVTSTRPVREPYLNFLMEVRWPSGRVLREFTLLLDPPLYDPAPVTFSAPVTPPATAASGAVRTPAPAPAAAPAPTTSTAAVPAPSAAPASAPAAADGQRRTTRADTLWGIALETRPAGSSVHQTMLAIQDLNPNAFIGNNINTLKAGQTLTLPNAEQAAVRSQAEAIAEVGSQTAAWQNRQPASEPAQRQLDARERSVASDAPSQTQGEDSLRLVAGSADSSDESVSSSGGQDGGLRDTLDQTKEQLDSAEQAKSELTDRLADVEGQLETLQRLLTLKDAQLAALQRELADEGTLPDILPVPEDEVATESEALDDDALTELADITPVEAVETDLQVEQQAEPTELDALAQVETEEGGQDTAGNDEEQVALAPAATSGEQSATGPDNGSASPVNPNTPAPADTPVAPEAQSESAQNSSPEALLQRFMQNQALLLGTGAVALLVLLLILMSIARRNARREEELSDNYMAASAVGAGSVEEEGNDFNVALADAQDAQDEAEQGAAPDPLAEADELISYDELNEAAELLEDAIDQEPERVDLRLKMMEVEAKLENQQGYAIQVEALKSMGVADSSVELMNARYPLMAAGLVTGAALLDAQTDTVAQAPQSDAEILEQPLLDEQGLQEVALTEDDMADFDFSDFGLEEDTAASLADASEQEAGFDLDFDLDEGEADLPVTAAAPTADSSEELPAFEEPLLDSASSGTDEELDLDLDDELQAENLLAEFEAMSAVGESELQSDTDTLETASDDSFSLSDEDLAGFEAQLQTEVQAESSAGAFGDLSEQSGDNAGAYNKGTASEGLMVDGLDEDFDFLSDTDECATKLDLARAYIDMGDEEGARDILAEVVDEGSEQQQQDAREMMGQLG